MSVVRSAQRAAGAFRPGRPVSTDRLGRHGDGEDVNPVELVHALEHSVGRVQGGGRYGRLGSQ